MIVDFITFPPALLSSCCHGNQKDLSLELFYCELHLVCKRIGYADLQTTNMNDEYNYRVNSNKRSVVLRKTIFGTMYSCESARTKAYSNNLRWRMVYQRCMLGLTYEEVTSRLSVDPSTVWHIVQRFEEHGPVNSCYTHERPPKTLTALDKFTILEAVTNRPAVKSSAWWSRQLGRLSPSQPSVAFCTKTIFRAKSSSV